MFNPKSKSWYFIFEALSSLACGFYANYIFFLLRDRYGFGNVGNLWVAALQGLVFAIAAWQGGRFAQRQGCLVALRLGLIGMTVFLLLGSLNPAMVMQLVVMAGWTASMCLIWPALEALVSEGESRVSLKQRLGVYNIVWATCSAASYFFGGAIFEHLGSQSLYYLPAGVCILQLVILWRLTRGSDPVAPAVSVADPSDRKDAADAEIKPAAHGRTFLHMAWLANPFASMAINTLLAMIPGLAREFHLSTTAAGLFCSVWLFGRLASFILLWRWEVWHYRVRWLLGAFLGLGAGLATVLLAHQFWLLLLAQMIFGLSVGLLYYSSLFYSMDVGQTKAEHGGVHEAAMGLGNCLGPATGAAGLLLAPHVPQAGAYAVSGLLVLGFAGLAGLWLRRENAIASSTAASR